MRIWLNVTLYELLAPREGWHSVIVSVYFDNVLYLGVCKNELTNGFDCCDFVSSVILYKSNEFVNKIILVNKVKNVHTESVRFANEVFGKFSVNVHGDIIIRF